MARAAKKAKKDAIATPELEPSTADGVSRAEPVVPSTPAIESNTATSAKQTSLSQSSDSIRRNPPRSRSASTPVMLGSKASAKGPTAPIVAHSKGDSTSVTRPLCKTAAASCTLLQTVVHMQLSDDSDADTDLHGDLGDLQEYYNEDRSLDISSDSDGSLDIGVDESGQLSIVRPTQGAAKAKLAAVLVARSKAKQMAKEVDEDSDTDSVDQSKFSYDCCLSSWSDVANRQVFDIPYEVNDPNESVHSPLGPLSSTVLWDDFRSQVAKVLNLHPDNLHLQYKFSNEPKGAFPFNLNTSDLYDNLLQRFKPIAIANHQRKGNRKEVKVEITNKDTTGEGKVSGKTSKVRTVYGNNIQLDSDL